MRASWTGEQCLWREILNAFHLTATALPTSSSGASLQACRNVVAELGPHS